MKYLKYFLLKIKKFSKGILTISLPFLFILGITIFPAILESEVLEDVSLSPNDYCHLTDVDYTAILHDDSDGKANVEITEYLTFDIHAGSKSNPFKELWRELPEDEVDGLKVTYDVKYVAEVLKDGTEVPYKNTSKMYWEDSDYTLSATKRWHHSKGSGKYPDDDESLLIYIPWTYREKKTFKIVYSLNNAALKYKDCSELYLSMYSGNTITKLKSYKAKILIPNEIMPSTYYSYTFGTANSRIPYTESDSEVPGYHAFLIDLDKSDLKFNYHNRYIEFCLISYGNDKHIFTQNAPNNRYSKENALSECVLENTYYQYKNQIYSVCKVLLLALSIVISIFIVLHTIRKYKKTIKKYTLYKPEVDYEYFREIPSDLDPIFASQLVFMKDPFNSNQEKQEEYAAILLSLARKKYITMTKQNNNSDWDKNNTLINIEPLETTSTTSPESGEIIYTTINKNNGTIVEPLTTSERLYFELLVRHTKGSNTISIAKLQMSIDNDYNYTNAFIKDIDKKPALESGVMQGYFQQTDYNELKNKIAKSAKSSLVFAIILFTAVNFISYFTPMALAFGAYTILGIALLWKYFYLTIKSSDLILFSQFGANEQAKWYGLYNFLNSDTLINEKNIPDLVLWEKYLIYATAFGISEKVIKAIKICANTTNIDNSLILNHHCYVHSAHFHSTSRACGRSIHTSSRGGGFGGHHGYGGGGRGGRWWWRWPLK